MEIVRLHHDMPLAGHLGQEKMLELLERSYFWLGMSMYVKNYVLLQFSSLAVLFSSSHPFMPHLLSWGPFLMLIITIFLSWDPLHSPYAPSSPYTISCITAGQGIPFAYRFLVMDTYFSSWFSHIGCVPFLLILFSMIFHDILFLLSGMFYLVPQHSFTYSADLFLSI